MTESNATSRAGGTKGRGLLSPRTSGTTADTRRQIIDAAFVVLDRLTFTKVTMDDIAKQAGIARQTIYKYFGGKDDLVVAIFVQHMMEVHQPPLAKLARRKPSERNLGDLILTELDLARSFGLFSGVLDPSVAPRMAELVFHPPDLEACRLEIWDPILTRYDEAGVLRSGLDHRAVVRWITYQQYWLLTHPDVLCEDDEEVEYYIRELLVPALLSR